MVVGAVWSTVITRATDVPLDFDWVSVARPVIEWSPAASVTGMANVLSDAAVPVAMAVVPDPSKRATVDPADARPVTVTAFSLVMPSVADAPVSVAAERPIECGVAGRSTGARDGIHRTPPRKVPLMPLPDWSASVAPRASVEA